MFPYRLVGCVGTKAPKTTTTTTATTIFKILIIISQLKRTELQLWWDIHHPKKTVLYA